LVEFDIPSDGDKRKDGEHDGGDDNGRPHILGKVHTVLVTCGKKDRKAGREAWEGMEGKEAVSMLFMLFTPVRWDSERRV
jgi:hypothetical protein